MPIHNFYEQLTEDEKTFVDSTFHGMFKIGKTYGIRLRGDDSAEHAVEAVAKWVVESRG